MSKLPKGITEEDLAKYAKIKKQLDRVLPVFNELESRVKSAYSSANSDIEKQKVIVVDEAGLVVTLKPRTKLNAEEFEANVPYDNDENKKYYKVAPIPAEVQKDFGKTYYTSETPSVSVALAS